MVDLTERVEIKGSVVSGLRNKGEVEKNMHGAETPVAERFAYSSFGYNLTGNRQSC